MYCSLLLCSPPRHAYKHPAKLHSVDLRPICLLRLSLLRFLDSHFPGNSLWAWEFHPSIFRFCLMEFENLIGQRDPPIDVEGNIETQQPVQRTPSRAASSREVKPSEVQNLSTEIGRSSGGVLEVGIEVS